jgi:hypothetical protein
VASRIPLGDIGTAFELTGEKPASPYARFGTMLPASQPAGAQRTVAPAPGRGVGAPAASTPAGPAAGVKTVPAGKPIPWDEVVKLPEMRGLSSDELEQARDQYFIDVVAPQVPTEELGAAREAFDADTKPGRLNRALNALTETVRGVRNDGGVKLSGETLDQLERSYRSLKQGVFAVDLGATRRALNVLDRVESGERVVPHDDPYSFRVMTPAQRAEYRKKRATPMICAPSPRRPAS